MFALWHHWSRKKRWLVSLGMVAMLLILVSTALLHRFLRVPRLPLPAGVSKRTENVTLAGKSVTVDFYLPPTSEPAPVVVIAHGFTRNRKSMAGWGAMVAKAGFLAVVPDLPTWADHPRNGHALAELLAKARDGALIREPKPAARAALVGFSAGGLSSLFAASESTNVACWVGLDPVGLGARAPRQATNLNFPAFVLRAEPAPWNAQGNARQIFAALPGPALSLAVKGASHVDAENPTSRAADWACGKSDPARRERFGHYLIASLRVGLLGDEAALRQLHQATNDSRVCDVSFRKPEGFRGAK